MIGGEVVDASAAAKVAALNIDSERISNRTIIQWTPEQQSQLEDSARRLADSNPPDVFPLESIRLGPPIPNPDKIICLGLNYHSHAQEAGFESPKIPILFAKYRNALTGPTSPIMLPSLSKEIDYEAELAVIIGKQCKNISAENALDHVAGYMAFNDISARDL